MAVLIVRMYLWKLYYRNENIKLNYSSSNGQTVFSNTSIKTNLENFNLDQLSPFTEKELLIQVANKLGVVLLECFGSAGLEKLYS